MIDLKGFEEYLHENELSPSTVNLYMATLKKFSEKYDSTEKKFMIDFKSEMFSVYSPKTVNLRLSALRTYCEYKNIPCTINAVKMQKISHIENVITVAQYRKLIDSLEQDGQVRWIANIKIISMTGARISEALRITKADVLRGYATMFTKRKIRTIQIPQSLTDELQAYLKPFHDDETVIRNKNNQPMDRNSYYNALQKFSRYGIPKEVLHPHSLRHFFAIEFIRRNPNVSLLADILGHSTVNTTMIYLRMSQEGQKRAVDEAVDW